MVVIDGSGARFFAVFFASCFVMNGMSLGDGSVSWVQFIRLQRQVWCAEKAVGGGGRRGHSIIDAEGGEVGR